jgi:hypothetical protein
MYKTDINKWQAAVAAAEGDADGLTLLYSIRAHGRGRIHCRQRSLTFTEAHKLLGARVPDHEDFTAAGGVLTLELGLHEQGLLIGDRWKEFVDQRWAVEKAFATPPEEMGDIAVQAARMK